jgi:hypothetical protein
MLDRRMSPCRLHMTHPLELVALSPGISSGHPAAALPCRNWQCDGCAVRAQGTLPTMMGRITTLATLNLQARHELQRRFLCACRGECLCRRAACNCRVLCQYLRSATLCLSTLDMYIDFNSHFKVKVHECILSCDDCDLLQGNHFSGPLPALWGAVDNWPRLQVLFLNFNNLTGTLPPVRRGRFYLNHLQCCKAW